MSGRDLVEIKEPLREEKERAEGMREERSEEKRKKKIKKKGFHTLEVLTIENQRGDHRKGVFANHTLSANLWISREKKQRGKRVKDLILGK